MKKMPAWASGPVWLEARESGEWWPSAQALARGDCDITGADTWWTFTDTSFWHCLQPPAQGWEWGKGTALCLQVHDGSVMAGAAHGGSGNVQGCCPPSSLVSWARDLSCRPPSCTGTIQPLVFPSPWGLCGVLTLDLHLEPQPLPAPHCSCLPAPSLPPPTPKVSGPH